MHSSPVASVSSPVSVAQTSVVQTSVAQTSVTQTSAAQADASESVQKSLFRERFKILKRIGRGGFSTAYLAQELLETHTQLCVIKHVKYGDKHDKQTALTTARTAIAQERSQRRFQKEARMMARLGHHDQLPCLLDHFVEAGQFYLVQEYIPGPTFQQLLGGANTFDEVRVKAFLRDIIPVVRYVHRHNLLHLDIKPANIICRENDGRLVLIDFGAVRRYNSGDAQMQPKPGSGTVGFAASEQFAGLPTPASDIYGLGATCLYLLTGCNPADLATSPNGLDLRWQESVTVSDHFNRILHKMLAPKAEHRFQSVDELERALGLEAHYGELKPCMTREPLSSARFKRPVACRLEDPAEKTDGQSFATRQAREIRRWQQRRRHFKSFTPS